MKKNLVLLVATGLMIAVIKLYEFAKYCFLIAKRYLAIWILRAINWSCCKSGQHDPLFLSLDKDKEPIYKCEHCGCDVTYADGRWFRHENNPL